MTTEGFEDSMTPPTDEFASRVARLRTALAQRRLAAIIIDDCEALQYFTGYDISHSFYQACIIPTEGEPFFVLRELDAPGLRASSWIKDIIAIADWDSPVEEIARQIEAHGLARAPIGVDLCSRALTIQTYEALKVRLKAAQFVDVNNLTFQLRKTKSASEIVKVQAAADVANETMKLLVDRVHAGMTESDAARLTAETFTRLGSDPGPLGNFTVGKGWDFVHVPSHNRTLSVGDVLHLEVCPRIEGYCARMWRSLAIGAASPEQHRSAELLRSFQDRQFEAMKPGARARDVDKILREAVIGSGMRSTYSNITGYTLGYNSNYTCRASDFTWAFHPRADWVIEEGMVFHMYTSAAGTVYSETILIEGTGIKRLTTVERRLFSSDIYEKLE